MAFGREFPHSFEEALRVSKRILGTNHYLVSQQLLDVESEILVMSAYRLSTGESLSRVEFYSRIKDRFPEVAAERLLIMAGARAEGRPLQHLTGVQVFLDHEYQVGPDVLVPRPETEVLLMAAVSELLGRGIIPNLGMEIGLGSGVLSTELLFRFSSLRMVASELSPSARLRASANAERILGVGSSGSQRLTVLSVSDSLQVLETFEEVVAPNSADFLITNPPYLIRNDEIEASVTSYEPHEALFAPAQDPLHFYREIANKVEKFLRSGGIVFAEIPHERASEISELFDSQMWSVRILCDLSQRNRVLVATLKEKNG